MPEENKLKAGDCICKIKGAFNSSQIILFTHCPYCGEPLAPGERNLIRNGSDGPPSIGAGRFEELDLDYEKGFVFLDRASRPYLCRIWCGDPWLFYWHSDNHWVSLKQVEQTDVWLYPDNLTKEQQRLYHDLDAKWERSMTLRENENNA